MQSRQKPDETHNDYLFLDTITAAVDETKTNSQNEAEYVTLSVHNIEVKLKLDTGAEVNVILITTYKILASTTRIPLRKPTVNLIAYNGKPVSVKAVCDLQCLCIEAKSMIWNFTYPNHLVSQFLA